MVHLGFKMQRIRGKLPLKKLETTAEEAKSTQDTPHDHLTIVWCERVQLTSRRPVNQSR